MSNVNAVIMATRKNEGWGWWSTFVIGLCLAAGCGGVAGRASNGPSNEVAVIMLTDKDSIAAAVGKRVQVSGRPEQYDGGAFVFTSFHQGFRLPDISTWHEGVLTSRGIIVTGTLVHHPGWLVSKPKDESAGIPWIGTAPPGTWHADEYWLTDITWEKLP